MPSLLTFGELKASDVPDIAGVCATSDQFRQYTNRATRQLMNRGDFWGTVEKMMVCTYNDCIVWPRYVGTPIALNFNGRPTNIWNNWYQFFPLCLTDFGPYGFSSCALPGCVGYQRDPANIQSDGMVPVFNPIPCGKQYYIRVYPSTQQDKGKTVTIFGIDENGLQIRTQVNGVWQEGVTLTLDIPFVSTPFKLREVTRITKQATSGVVRYYQYDADNDTHMDLVWHDPSELTPMYRQTKLPRRRSCDGTCPTTPCNGLASIQALVKLEFQPVSADSDLVLISNQDALRDMIIGIRESDNGDKERALAYETSAIHELNLESRNKYPSEQTPVVINPFGAGGPEQHFIGRII